MCSQLEPAIWSRDTGRRILCFDRCQLTLTWMSNIKDVRCKLWGQLEYGRHFWLLLLLLIIIIISVVLIIISLAMITMRKASERKNVLRSFLCSTARELFAGSCWSFEWNRRRRQENVRTVRSVVCVCVFFFFFFFFSVISFFAGLKHMELYTN